MEWVFIGIMIFTNVIVIGCCMYAYRNYGKVQNHLLLDVTFTDEQLQDGEINAIVAQYNKVLKLTHIIGIVTSFFPFVFIFMDYCSLFTITFLLWCFGYLLMPICYGNYKHKELYRLKIRKGYTAGKNTRTIKIDTRVTADSEKMPVSIWWMFPTVLCCFIPFVWKETYHMWSDGREALMILGIPFLTKAAYLIGYEYYARRRNVVFTEDTERNYACNRLTKHDLSLGIVLASYVDSTSLLFLQRHLIKTESDTVVPYVMFVILQSICCVILVANELRVQKKRKLLLEHDETEYIVDDDEYWAEGYYYNPNDNHLLVQNRSVGTNMSFNMAKPAAKVIVGILEVGTVVLILWMCYIMVPFDFSTPQMVLNESYVEIDFPSYEATIPYREITQISLLDEMPDVRFTKINGASTSTKDLGKYRCRDLGNCYLYVLADKSPILRIDTAECVYFYNYGEQAELEQYYQEIIMNME